MSEGGIEGRGGVEEVGKEGRRVCVFFVVCLFVCFRVVVCVTQSGCMDWSSMLAMTPSLCRTAVSHKFSLVVVGDV